MKEKMFLKEKHLSLIRITLCQDCKSKESENAKKVVKIFVIRDNLIVW